MISIRSGLKRRASQRRRNAPGGEATLFRSLERLSFAGRFELQRPRSVSRPWQAKGTGVRDELKG